MTRAVEKLAGPELPDRQPVKSTLHDLYLATPDHVQSTREEIARLAVENKVQPGSEAALEWMARMEDDILAQLPGEEGIAAVNNLPWRAVVRADRG